ncbi:MAG: WYL domain-containing protein [Actinomycetaceae bacterium]|nr:WYL domain-containing protein [Actinomycetaceae bacterium]
MSREVNLEKNAQFLIDALGLLAWVNNHPQGVAVSEAAAHFSVEEKDIHALVTQVLMMIGLGEYAWDCIDFDLDLLENRDMLKLSMAYDLEYNTLLNPAESAWVLAGLDALGQALAEDRTDDIASVALKFAQVSGHEPATNDVRALDILSLGVDSPDRKTALDWTDAAQQRKRLEFSYVDSADVTSLRRSDIQETALRNGIWYAYGWDVDKQGWRTFRIDRVLEWKEAGQADVYENIPAWDLSFSAASMAKEGELTKVTIKLHEGPGWQRDMLLVFAREDDPLATTVTIEVANAKWLDAVLAVTAGGVKEVSPPQLAHNLARRAKAALELYS